MKAADADKSDGVLCLCGATSADVCPAQVNSDPPWQKFVIKIN